VLTDAQLLQFSVTLVLAVIVFTIAFSLSPRVSATALILLIPFQPIDTKYASANVLLTFVVLIALLMKGTSVRIPMLTQCLVLFFAYMISLGLSHPTTLGQHSVYMLALISAFFVLWISYDLTMRLDSIRDMVNIFVIMNILAVIYSIVQLVSGSGEKIVFFGIEEFHMNHTRSDRRLTGPFGSAGIAAEYTVIMLFMILYQILWTSNVWRKSGLMLLGAVNILLLIATGNRGGFLVMIGAGLIFLWIFRKLLGPVRAIGIAATAVALVSIATIVATTYTDFDLLFTRLADTEIESGIPDTRSVVWPAAWKAIKDKPILGHGPRLRFDGEDGGGRHNDHLYIPYPHNLYLFLLFTVGVVGLMAYIIFLVTPLVKCWSVTRRSVSESYEVGFARAGMVFMVIVLVDGIKIDFTRFVLVDYWHFIFALIGLLVATCDRVKMMDQSSPNSQLERARNFK
jgi:O-antigen ligase